MKIFLFSLIIISTDIILSIEKEDENNSFNQTGHNQVNNTNIERKADSNNFHYISSNRIYVLNDFNFDIILQNGNYYKWLVILYSETCVHCEHARGEIRKIFPQYKNSTTIRFAEIEININHMTDIRFDYIEGVPYIFLLQNNSLYEMDLYPSEKNLIKFIETDFKNVSSELSPFPTRVGLIKAEFLMIKNSFRGVIEGINELLYIYGYKFQITPLLFFLLIIVFILFVFLLDYFCCSRLCPDEKIKREIIRKINEVSEKEKEKETEKNKEKEIEETKELSEEEKKERELEKENKEKSIKEEKILKEEVKNKKPKKKKKE